MAKKEQRKDAEKDILEAAKKIFIEKGYTGARMQAIADEANINKAMLHYYFRSKEALFDRILESTVELMSQNLIPALSGEGTVIEKVRRLVNGYVDVITQNPYIPMFILNELAQNQVNFQQRLKENMQRKNVFVNFMMQVQKEQKEGLLQPIPPHHFILSVMSLIIFPFLAKPVFTDMLEIPESKYMQMMQERKEIVMEIIKKSFVK